MAKLCSIAPLLCTLIVNGPGAAVNVAGLMKSSPSSTSIVGPVDTGVAVTPSCDRSVSYAAVAITPTPKATTTRNPAMGPSSISLPRSFIAFRSFSFLDLDGGHPSALPLSHSTRLGVALIGPKVINSGCRRCLGGWDSERAEGAAFATPSAKRAGTERLRQAPGCFPFPPGCFGGVIRFGWGSPVPLPYTLCPVGPTLWRPGRPTRKGGSGRRIGSRRGREQVHWALFPWSGRPHSFGRALTSEKGFDLEDGLCDSLREATGTEG